MASTSTSTSGPTPSNNIRAFVQWKEPTVFSGEEIECIITFKNTASVGGAQKEETEESRLKNDGSDSSGRSINTTNLTSINSNMYNNDDNHNDHRSNNPLFSASRANGGLKPRIERQRTVTQSTGVSRGPFSTAPSAVGTNSRVPSSSRGHRPTLSLNMVPSPTIHNRTPSASTTPQSTSAAFAGAASRPLPRHGRSLSIMSLQPAGPTASSPNHNVPNKAASPAASQRPAKHTRSTSLQVVSRWSVQPSPVIAHPSPRQQPLPPPPPPPPPPTMNQTSPDAIETPPLSSFPQGADYLSMRPKPRKNGISTAPNTPAIVLPNKSPSATFATDFAFPAPPNPVQHAQTPSPAVTPEFDFPPRPAIVMPKPRQRPSRDKMSASLGSLNPISRLISDTSTNDTPRTSSDFDSFTTNSSETLASETPLIASARLLTKPAHKSTFSTGTAPSQEGDAELLIMGYAQTMGSFTLDASLVNPAPFEHVKRKGVLGGQAGGGVVGVERSKRDSGMFASFGWGNIGQSLGGLLGPTELSSIKEMRGAASSRSIPLLSTPQSVLFVDLRLAPGQSKSYSYRFRLPRGLPPTHKGRAIKVHYYINIGVQRSGNLGRHQNIKHIEVPFRVLGSVNSRGESLGHDLMSPYILLHDQARTSSVAAPETLSLVMPAFPSASPSTPSAKPSSAALQDFLEYADRLLVQPSSASAPLLSPTPQPQRQRSSSEDPSPTNMKEAIDVAILRSNLSSSAELPSQSTNRFTIARSGQSVAVISMLRPAYRLGETIIGVVDFVPQPDATSRSPAIHTYTLSITLETVERIDPSVALRSASSVQRATRKAYAHFTESVLFARQTSFRLEVPTSATPTFETTGVHLSWRLRVEFITAKSSVPPNGTRGLGIIGGDASGSEDETVQADSPTVDTSDDLLDEVVRDDRGIVLIARERLVAEAFDVAVPIHVYGVSGLGAEGALENGIAVPLEV